MKLGVVGLPNVGKSTLFNAITKAGAECANYPFCTIEPNIGVVAVPDERLDKLGALYNSKKITPTTLEFVDIAGLVKGASQGEGLGNKFLSHIREVDAIAHVVRCFDNDNIIHIDNSINPKRDTEIINLELILSDIESMEKRLNKTRIASKSGEVKYLKEIALQEKIINHLNKGKALRSMIFSEEEQKLVNSYFLLTTKPVIYVANISEDDLNKADNKYVIQLKEIAQKEQAEIIVLSIRIEEELSALSYEDSKMFFDELGIQESGLNKLVKACYSMLGLISYLTAGEKETRAWTIKKGTKAPQAAGKIHTDFEKGFIRAEVIDCEQLLELKSYQAAKEKGKVRSEGKDYIVKDGDVILFRFNV